ncbi:MAG: hypothetical protein LBU24_01090 [Methanocalculaceae archaeon]|jgi:hypothetical protein|nr:hypothetical protein [Methanocalculaceae archaeon]
METKEIKHVYVWSAAKFYAAVCLVVGCIHDFFVDIGEYPVTYNLTKLLSWVIGCVIIFSVDGLIGGFIVDALLSLHSSTILLYRHFGGLRVYLESCTRLSLLDRGVPCVAGQRVPLPCNYIKNFFDLSILVIIYKRLVVF